MATKRRKRVAEFVGYIAVTEHVRRHGFTYADPTHNVQYSDAYTPSIRMIAPEEISENTHHYDVRFAYEGEMPPSIIFDRHTISKKEQDTYNNFWRRFQPTKVLYFYCTPCTRTSKACQCLASECRYTHCHWDTERNVWRQVLGENEQSSEDYFRSLNRCYDIHLKFKNPLFYTPYCPDAQEERDEEYWRQKYDVEWSIEWTLDALAELWRSLLSGRRQNIECESFQQRQRDTGERGPANCHGRDGTETRYEKGCGWGAIRGGYYSTDINGTQHKIYSIDVEEAEKQGAHSIAAEIIDHTHKWPGWRTVRVEAPGGYSGGKYLIELYGGRSQ